MDVRKYLFSWKLDEDFIKRIETVVTWINSRDLKCKRMLNALFVTKDNEVYAIGELINKCHKRLDGPSAQKKKEDTWGLTQPVLLEKLSHKRIKKFAITFNHVFFCTEEGQVWGYGHYKYKSEAGFNMPSRVAQLEEIKVVDIAAGVDDDALLVLSEDGQVYHWVLMQSQFYLQIIDFTSFESKPISVFSGSRLIHFFVLLENGKVVKVTRHIQELMHFRNATDEDECKIVTMSCGLSHALLLDKDGRLFVTGCNTDGQMGLGERKRGSDKLELNRYFTEKIVDIATTPSCSLSAVMTESHKIYMFGFCRGINVYEPILTSCSSLQEVFFHYAVPIVTHEPMKITELPVVQEPIAPVESTNEIKQTDCHSKLKNEQNSLNVVENGSNDAVVSVEKFCDLSFVMEGKSIAVHKTVLALRSEHFAEMFQQSSPEEIPKVLEIKTDDFKSCEAFLKYMYTDQIDETLSANEITELFSLANKYRVKKLADCCTSLMQPNISIENVIPLYESVAIMSKDPKMNDISKNLKELCVSFTMKNEKAVIKSEGFKKLNSDMAKDLILEVFERRSP